MKHPTQSANSKLDIRRLSFCAILCAAALTIFVVEAQIPLPIPLPGLKLGLANIITLFALIKLGKRDALLILVCRIILGAVFIGQPSILLYSLCGGIFSLLAESLFLKLLGRKFICEISIIGAMVHNTVQIICAVIITRTLSVFWYLPPLLIVASITGTFCGLCVALVDRRKRN